MFPYRHLETTAPSGVSHYAMADMNEQAEHPRAPTSDSSNER